MRCFHFEENRSFECLATERDSVRVAGVHVDSIESIKSARCILIEYWGCGGYGRGCCLLTEFPSNFQIIQYACIELQRFGWVANDFVPAWHVVVLFRIRLYAFWAAAPHWMLGFVRNLSRAAKVAILGSKHFHKSFAHNIPCVAQSLHYLSLSFSDRLLLLFNASFVEFGDELLVCGGKRWQTPGRHRMPACENDWNEWRNYCDARSCVSVCLLCLHAVVMPSTEK